MSDPFEVWQLKCHLANQKSKRELIIILIVAWRMIQIMPSASIVVNYGVNARLTGFNANPGQIVSATPAPSNGDRLPCLGKSAMWTRWMAGNAPHKIRRYRD